MSPGKIPYEHRQLVKSCEERIAYRFDDQTLLYEALTHASGADDRLQSNERLEFLGDAILGFVVCEWLFHRYPDSLEGDLTQIKSAAVSRSTCAKIGYKIGLIDFLVTGKGMSAKQGLPRSLVANAVESIIAAIFLDGGMRPARTFVVEHIVGQIREITDGKAELNFKSTLQQFAQQRFGSPPSYHLLNESGPDHCKNFQVCAQVGSERYSPAWGANKKQAEQRAAGNALAELDGEAPPFDNSQPL